MDYQFSNYSRHVGTRGDYDWYEWEIFMDEPPERMGEVESVEYRLHETFPNPVRIVEDPASRFALRSSGWGEFTVFINVHRKDGEEVRTRYYLDLSKPWPPGHG